MKKIQDINIIIYFIIICLIKCQENVGHFKIKDINKIINIKNDLPSSLNKDKFIIKKNVILGIIQNYSLSRVLPFFNSIFYSNFTNCDIVMFVRYVSANLINYLKSIGVIVYQISNIYNSIRRPNHLRWKMFINFLEENKNRYNLVFSVDVRDSFFQKDVFIHYANYSSFLGLALEDGILSEKINKNNIIKLAGIEKHNKIKDERIICMGTVLGTSREFLEFSNIMWEKLKLYNYPLSDQGLANFLFYYDKIMNNSIVKNDNKGPIMTIGLSNVENITLDYQGNILNYNGEIASVIHQYDRKKEIKMKIIKKFGNQLPKLINEKIIHLSNLSDNRIYNISNSKMVYSSKDIKDNYRNIISYILFFILFSIIIIIKLLIVNIKIKNSTVINK